MGRKEQEGEERVRGKGWGRGERGRGWEGGRGGG